MRINVRFILAVFSFLLIFCASCKKETGIPEIKDEIAAKEAASGSTTNATPATPTTPVTPVVSTNQEPSSACCKTQNVIIVVIDGPRYSETWGDYTHKNIPQQYQLYPQGVLLNNFMNNGTTLTEAGHAAISTGNYEKLENWGAEIPTYPSMFQAFLKATGKPADKAWIITSKDKLEVLGTCKQPDWADKYQPRTDCGVAGIFNGSRADEDTYNRVKDVMTTYHPNLMLINFKDPDWHGHGNLWDNYLEAIKKSDEYVKGLYDQIQNDPQYKDNTTLIVTNDHGRHLNSVANGFIDHGCTCEGCRHIQFFAIGPDFKKGINLNSLYEQTDISQTVAKLLNFPMASSTGKVMKDIFN